MIESYRDLIVWQRAIQMTLEVYRVTAAFPKDEVFGLVVQMRRAGVSAASHIAEGYGRVAPGDYKRYLGIARGSHLELQTHLVIAAGLGYGTFPELEGLSEEVSKMLNSPIAKV